MHNATHNSRKGVGLARVEKPPEDEDHLHGNGRFAKLRDSAKAPSVTSLSFLRVEGIT